MNGNLGANDHKDAPKTNGREEGHLRVRQRSMTRKYARQGKVARYRTDGLNFQRVTWSAGEEVEKQLSNSFVGEIVLKLISHLKYLKKKPEFCIKHF